MSAPDVALVGAYPDPGTLHSGRTGVASYTANLARALDDAGADVVVIADRGPDQPEHAYDGGVQVLRPFTRGLWSLPKARDAAERSGAAIVHVQHEHFLYGGPTAVPGLLASLPRISAPLVVTMHQVVRPAEVDGAFTKLHRVAAPAFVARRGIEVLQSRLVRAADAVIVHEPKFATVIPDAVVVPHGIEVAQRWDHDFARATLGLGDELVVLCFGFLAPYKGLELAIAAAERAGPAVQLVVAGGEHPRLDGHDRYADELRASAPANARFTGYVPADDVARWFSAADVVLVTHHLPFSASGALALALGYRTPALISAELAECVAAPAPMAVARDPEQLGARLRRLALDRQKWQRLRDANDELARGRTWPDVAQRHLELYEEVLDGHRPARRRVWAMQSG